MARRPRKAGDPVTPTIPKPGHLGVINGGKSKQAPKDNKEP